MSDAGFITYVSVGEECGIYNIQGTSAKSHLVCRPGAACITTINFDLTQSTQCQRLYKAEGEQCRDNFYECVNAYTCMRNEFEVNTCNGISFWKGNPFITGKRTPSLFENDITSIVLGSVILFIWLSGVVAYLFTKIREERLADGVVNDETERLVIYGQKK